MCQGGVEGFYSTSEITTSNEKSGQERNNSDSESQKHSEFAENRKRKEEEEKGRMKRAFHRAVEKNEYQGE